jgi:hypothetical protein
MEEAFQAYLDKGSFTGEDEDEDTVAEDFVLRHEAHPAPRAARLSPMHGFG